MEAAGSGNLFAVRKFEAGHQRCFGIGPFQAEAGVLVAAQVVESAQLPAGNRPIQLTGKIAPDGSQVLVRSGGSRDERGADPQLDGMRLAADEFPDMLQIFQDLSVGNAGEVPVQRRVE